MNEGSSLPANALNRSSHVSLYFQLYSLLAQAIKSGKLKPGDLLPSERELIEQYNVSRITIRKAIDALVDHGLVYREQGRGTYVAAQKMHGIVGFASFTEVMAARGLRAGSRILTQELVPAGEELGRILRIEPEELVLNLLRLRLADGQPVAIQSTYLPNRLVPGLEHEELANKSIYKILQQHYYIQPCWTEAEIEARGATAEEAGLLEILEGNPVLVVKGITFTESFEVIESVCTVYTGKSLSLYIGRQRISSEFGH